MRRTPPILTTIGFALLLIAILFGVITSQTSPTPAQAADPAALPANHPPLPGTTAVTNPNGPFPLPTNPNAFFQPGTQPNTIQDRIAAPMECTGCHSDYSSNMGANQPADYEPWTGWQGSMMAQAGRDPLFYAALDIANAYVENGGDFCLRCHASRAWFDGRVQNGVLIEDPIETPHDLEGIQCEICHRMVDPVYSAENPARDLTVLAAITVPVTSPGNAQIILDPLDHRRGPFDIVADNPFPDPHPPLGARDTLQSPFHREAAICAGCHDISNPLLIWDPISSTYKIHTGDPVTDTSVMFPIERTYSEWLMSSYNSEQGIYAPEFGGNITYVSTCQDCHMRKVTGVGGNFFGSLAVERDDLPMHDLTGANTWVPQIIPLHPVFSATFNSAAYGDKRLAALELGIDRARYMLQNAADVIGRFDPDTQQLTVTIINNSGHKLPTGYAEGRRMWIQVEGYDAAGNLIYQSGAYNLATGELTHDPDLQIYESKQGLTTDWAAQLGLPAGESFHFILNNTVISDNRIPPRGYTFANYLAIKAEPRTNNQPDPTLYADGQYWDDVVYQLPPNVTNGRIRLLHQVASKEYIEFLRENNPEFGINPNNNGEILYDLWQMTNKSAPETMAELVFGHDAYVPIIQKP